MKSINDQKPATKNQITNNKPSIIKNANVLQGYLANSFNGGMLKTIAYHPIMAGTKAMDYRIRLNLRMLTPKTPVYQRLKLTLKCYFVPNSRVWPNWEKFLAQKGGATENKIKEIPNLGGLSIPIYRYSDTDDNVYAIPSTDTEILRDCYIASYLPRFQCGAVGQDGNIKMRTLPKYSILPIRGFKAIYNDFERNKEYDEELTEYKTDTVTSTEWNSYFPMQSESNDFTKLIIRGKRQNSYYTDYRTELLGEDTENPLELTTGQPLTNLVEWEKTLAELRDQAENAQANDWDIIAKIRGSKKLTQGKVQLLGTSTHGINYQTVTQDTYNTNEAIKEDFQILGQQGAYSYTEIDTSMFQMQEFIEDGYLHVIAQVSADTVFETGFERTGLNVKWDDMYRPDLRMLKEDVLYEIEKCGTRLTETEDLTKVTGYKRKFSEYFKSPNILTGDLMTLGYISTEEAPTPGEPSDISINKDNEGYPIYLESKRTFQFFEQDDKETGRYQPKNIWEDYTDILINRNQAILNEVTSIEKDGNKYPKNFIRIKGDNQFFCLGMQSLIADLPIDENIKNNYTKWGEL